MVSPVARQRSDIPTPVDNLVEEIAQDMARRWQGGERPAVEEYLSRYPQLADWPQAAVELLFEEVCQRRERGSEVLEAELSGRFPQWQEQIRILLDCQRLLAGEAVARFPEAGESFADFRLLRELGRGAQGRVFLASQPQLADRRVVLKLVPGSSSEHLSLARLQHSHIVPLFSAHDDPRYPLRALCMPHFGGASLAALLETLHEIHPRQRTGQHVVAALTRNSAGGVSEGCPGETPGDGDDGPGCRFLASFTYPRLVAWVGVCLADALRYAHERRLVHLDLKPSNVLLAADGTPMLLDFHLARPPIATGKLAPEWLGGTPGYMPPEQQLALQAVRAGQVVPQAVDGRADIYGLGSLLFEALAAGLPQPATRAAAHLRRVNPQVSPGLADIIGRCLASNPSQRYLDAATLAEDLRRHLADLPLRGVGNRSVAERWLKWRARRPYAPAVLGLILAAGAVATPVFLLLGRQTHKAQTALEQGREALRQHRYDQAVADLQRGLALVEDVPLLRSMPEEFRHELHRAERGRLAQELHAFMEQMRGLYGDIPLADADARRASERCQTYWDKKDLVKVIFDDAENEPGRTPVRADMADLAVLCADLRVRLAPSGVAAARREALAVLNEARQLFGDSCVLAHQRRRLMSDLGLPAAGSPDPPARSAWEHRALGQARFRAGDLVGAEAEFDRALAMHPQDFWASFYKGRCAFRFGRHDDAVIAFTACLTLAPQRGWCAYNRGLAHAELGRLERALQDHERALALDPGLAPAALERAVVLYRLRRYPEALAGLDRAAKLGAPPDRVHHTRAMVHLAQGDTKAAVGELRRSLMHYPGQPQVRALLQRLAEAASEKD